MEVCVEITMGSFVGGSVESSMEVCVGITMEITMENAEERFVEGGWCCFLFDKLRRVVFQL